jgi:hypothetical protein
VTRYLEIGARHGDTFFDVMCSLPRGSYGVAVDLPGGAWGTVKSRDSLVECVAELQSRGYKASVLFGNSASASTASLVAKRGPYDLVLIDGDHRLEGVTADWNIYGPMAKYAAFHDIAGDGVYTRDGSMEVQVPLLWRSLRARQELNSVEFIDAKAPAKMGIGVVWL